MENLPYRASNDLMNYKAFRSIATPKNLLVSQKRYGSKINIQRPQKLFYERELVTQFVSPMIPFTHPPQPIWQKCRRVVRKKNNKVATKAHPYLRIVAAECLQRYRDSKMTAIFHKNSITQEEEFEFAVSIHKYNMLVKSYGMGISRVAFAGTEFGAILNLFNVSSMTVFSPEVNVEALRKMAKKVPQLTLLAGIIDGKLLNQKQFLMYGKMTLTDAQSQLVHTLRTAGGANLSRQLNHHQSTLVSRLRQIADAETATKDKVSDVAESNVETVVSEESKPE